MPLTAGSRLGTYEITVPLGAGGSASARTWRTMRELRRGRAVAKQALCR